MFYKDNVVKQTIFIKEMNLEQKFNNENDDENLKNTYKSIF